MKRVLIIGGILGLAIGLVLMFIALDHDPQGSVSSDFGWLIICLSWAAPVWLGTLIIAGVMKLIKK